MVPTSVSISHAVYGGGSFASELDASTIKAQRLFLACRHSEGLQLQLSQEQQSQTAHSTVDQTKLKPNT